MSSNKIIVFDLGGVLIDWNPRYLYRKMFNGNDAAMEKFLAEVCTPEWNARGDEGISLTQLTSELIPKHPDDEIYIRAWVERWKEMIDGPIQGTVEIFSELKKRGYKIYALSNWSADTFKRVRNDFEFFDWFDYRVISGEIKMVKPNRDIFNYLLDKANARAEDCIYIDDAPVNVMAAAEYGFDAIHFTSPEQLRTELALRKVF